MDGWVAGGMTAKARGFLTLLQKIYEAGLFEIFLALLAFLSLFVTFYSLDGPFGPF